MESTISPAGCQAILPLLHIASLGPASRTLAALVDIADQDRQTTFKSLARIAVIAGLSISTVARHLVTLEGEGYITKLGRQKQAGRRMARRTVTYRLITTVDDLLASPYLPLPKASRGLPWCQAATLAYMVRWSDQAGTLSTSARAISRAINMSVAAVKNALKSLLAAGLVSHGSAPTYWVVGVSFDRGGGSEMTVAVNLSFLEPNLETTPSQQEHTTEPSPPPVVEVVFARSSADPVATPPQGPSWLNIKPSDLGNAESRRALFFAAVAAGVIGDTHEQRCYFQACCVHAGGKENPEGYLRSMIEHRWNPPTRKPTGTGHNLGHVDRRDLVDPAAAVKIVETRMGPQSQHQRIFIAAEAIHALRVGKNPAGMFAANVAAGRFYATEADEDVALDRLGGKRAPQILDSTEPKPVSAVLADLLRPPD